MRVLISAYACEPGRGSEPEAGLRAVLAAASAHDVWVLTRENNLPALRRFLAAHPSRQRIQLKGLDLHGAPLRRKRRGGLIGLHYYYDRWQRAAAAAAAELDRRWDFDVVHHATFATYWARAGVAGLGKPFVWGPVGGAVTTPLGLLGELGARGGVEYLLRRGARAVGRRLPSRRVAIRDADVALVQNAATAERVRARQVQVVPNGVVVDLPRIAVAAGARRREVAVVGRLAAWKGGRLAVRALRHVSHADVPLVFYGEGPERSRLQSAARRWGVEARVAFAGHLPREALLERVATAGAVLHPSLHEEGGVAAAETLALGTPLVCLDRGGPAHQLTYWPTSPAAAVRPTTPEATARRLAAAVDRFLADPPPVPAYPTPPEPTFRHVLLAAYEQAAARMGTM